MAVAKTIKASMVQTLREFPTAKLPPVPRSFFAKNAERLLQHVPDDSTAKLARASADLPSYLRSLYEVPLLSPQDERGQFLKYNYARYLIRQAQPHVSITMPYATLKRLAGLCDIAIACQTLLVRRNLRLVVSVAKKWSVYHHWATFDDFVSEGNMSLIRAVQLFDVTRNFKFSTYATWAVQNGICRYYKANRRRQAYEFDDTDIPETAPDNYDVHAEIDEGELQGMLNGRLSTALNRLPVREAGIIRMRFGFDGNTALTLEEVGQCIGVSKERVRQLESRGMKMLRELLGDIGPKVNTNAPQLLPESVVKDTVVRISIPNDYLTPAQKEIRKLLNSRKNITITEIASALNKSRRVIKAQLTRMQNRNRQLANVA